MPDDIKWYIMRAFVVDVKYKYTSTRTLIVERRVFIIIGHTMVVEDRLYKQIFMRTLNLVFEDIGC